MQLQAIRSLSDLEALAGEWNDLLQHSASDVPFLRYEYLTTWFTTLGGGEWSAGDLYVVAGRNAQGCLAGIAPLFFTTNREGLPALMLLGSIEISDYLDVIVRHEDLAASVEALFDHLSTPQAPDWQVLDWWNLLDSSATLPVLQAAAERRGWTFTRELLQHCPSIPLPGDWERYLAEQVDKKQRHEIRRKMRRAESYDEPVRWYIVQDESRLDSEIEAFLDLMAHDAQKKSFLSDAMRIQMRLGARAAWDAGYLQLSFLEVSGQKAAGYINFDYENRIWVYNSGLDFSFRELSPGWVLLGYLLQWANENKRAVFDFLRGDEEYKYRFGGIDRHVVRAQITRQA
jgi:CelD/BcsL family acetyltransferase involved in cellulose biosynthesis